MSLHTPVTIVDSSAASTVALNAFDYLAARVQSDLLRCNPDIDSTLSAGDKKASLEEKVIAKQSNLGRDIKSGFQYTPNMHYHTYLGHICKYPKQVRDLYTIVQELTSLSITHNNDTT